MIFPLRFFYQFNSKNMKIKKEGRKKFYTLERITKGIGNHRRIEILFLLGETQGLSLFEISEKLQANFKTVSEHTRRLAHAGLVVKWSDGNNIRHDLTDLGKTILKFLRTLE